jgi:DNA-3-methyladenine glycosylase
VVARRSRGAPLPRSFYDRDVEVVARELLGAVLESHTDAGRVSGRIVETEAYLGPHDPASHAVAGLTDRTRHLFGPAGTSYVYFIYGTHWCFNAVTGRPAAGAAVLVRALEPLEGLEIMRARRPRARRDRDLTNGPGKLCAALGLDGAASGLSLARPPVLIRAGLDVPDADVRVSPRIGLTRAAELPHRYYVRDNPYVSATPGGFAVYEYR